MIYKHEWDLCDMEAGIGFVVICKLERDLRDMQAGMGFV